MKRNEIEQKGEFSGGETTSTTPAPSMPRQPSPAKFDRSTEKKLKLDIFLFIHLTLPPNVSFNHHEF